MHIYTIAFKPCFLVTCMHAFRTEHTIEYPNSAQYCNSNFCQLERCRLAHSRVHEYNWYALVGGIAFAEY